MQHPVESALYLGFLAAWFGIRAPYEIRARRERRAVNRSGGVDGPLLLSALLSIVVVPLVHLFSAWLAAADYQLPDACLGAGALLFVASLVILWRAHVELGRNFSVFVEIRQRHSLFTSGIYAVVRHPMYTHHLLLSLAQVLVLQNWVVGSFAVASSALVYAVRIPGEEKALLEEFGDSYRAYMRRTGRVLPRIGWFSSRAGSSGEGP